MTKIDDTLLVEDLYLALRVSTVFVSDMLDKARKLFTKETS